MKKNKSRRIVFLTAALIFFSVFILLSLIVHADFFRNFDYGTMVSAQKMTPSLADYPFSLLSLLASSELTFILIASLFAFWLTKYKQVFLGIFLYVLIYPMELLGKLLIYHPKPPLFFFKNVFNIHLPSSFI